MGGRKDPVWRVVVADQRSKRDGRVIETVGHYNPQTNPSTITIDETRVRDWLARGAQPTARCASCCASAASPAERGVAVAMDSTELLEYLAEGLVDDPEQVEVERFEERDGSVVLELAVGPDDYGKVIGRGGRTAQALRTVIGAAASAAGEDRRVIVDIVD